MLRSIRWYCATFQALVLRSESAVSLLGVRGPARGALGGAAGRVANGTSPSVEVTAGPNNALFAADATQVSISPSTNLSVVSTVTFIAPGNSSAQASASVGGLAGAGLVGGGEVQLGTNRIAGGSVSVGAGVSLPFGGAP